jgi:cell division protein FtsZ
MGTSVNKAPFDIRVNEVKELSPDMDSRDFDNIGKYTSRQDSHAEPFSTEISVESSMSKEELQAEQERRENLRKISVKLYNSQAIQDLENEPAYKRRKVVLEDVQNSADRSSRYVISPDAEPEIRKENPFLFDKAD